MEEIKLNLTKKDEYYLLNSKKVKRKAKVLNAIFFALSGILIGGVGIGYLTLGSLITSITPVLVASGIITVSMGTLLAIVLKANNEVKKCEKVCDGIKLFAQRHTSRSIGQGYTVVKSSNLVDNSKPFRIDINTIKDGEEVRLTVDHKTKSVGPIFEQLVVRDDEGLIGVIDKTINNIPVTSVTKEGSATKIVSNCSYVWKGPENIRMPYEPQPKKKVRK